MQNSESPGATLAGRSNLNRGQHSDSDSAEQRVQELESLLLMTIHELEESDVLGQSSGGKYQHQHQEPHLLSPTALPSQS